MLPRQQPPRPVPMERSLPTKRSSPAPAPGLAPARGRRRPVVLPLRKAPPTPGRACQWTWAAPPAHRAPYWTPAGGLGAGEGRRAAPGMTQLCLHVTKSSKRPGNRVCGFGCAHTHARVMGAAPPWYTPPGLPLHASCVHLGGVWLHLMVTHSSALHAAWLATTLVQVPC